MGPWNQLRQDWKQSKVNSEWDASLSQGVHAQQKCIGNLHSCTFAGLSLDDEHNTHMCFKQSMTYCLGHKHDAGLGTFYSTL